LIAIFSVWGCTHAPSEPPGPVLGERFLLRPGESASIRGDRLTITFEGILSDNRCPIDVVCITAGEARAAFRVERPGEPADSFELDTDRNPTRAVAGHQISLISVSPAPRSTVRIAPGDYRVELVVSR
jgi:hypothetical protein